MFASVCLKDGLGNQLFYVAAAYGYGRKHGRIPAILSGVAGSNPHSTEMYANSIFREFQKIDIHVDSVYSEPPEDCLTYHPIPSVGETYRNIFLNGFFQNEKYLEGYKKDFVRLLRFPDTRDVEARWGPFANTCFIHVRRGDYLRNSKHNVPLGDYYRRAMAFVKEQWESRVQGDAPIRFLVFSDDIAWCRQSPLFVQAECEFCTESHDATSMMLMAKCGVGGICANSTFSWWGAFLGFDEAASKIVTFPDKWFNGYSWQNDIAFKGAYVLEA